MKIIRAIILLSVGSSSATENIKDPKGLGVRSSINDCDAYCGNSYKSPYSQATCVRVLESIGVDCSRGMNFLQEEDAAASPEIAMSEIKESKGLDVHASIDDCDAYCRNSYKNPYNQATCVRVLESIGIDCSRGMNYLQEDDSSSETAMKEIKESKVPSPHFRVSLSDSSDERSNTNLRGSKSDAYADSPKNGKSADVTHAHDGYIIKNAQDMSADKEKFEDIGISEYVNEFDESTEHLTCLPEGSYCTSSRDCCYGLFCVYARGLVFCSP